MGLFDNLDETTKVLILILVIAVAIFLIFGLSLYFYEFSKELRYLNNEIKRNWGEERKH